MMIERADFDDLVNQAMQMPGHQSMRPVIEKELLHFDILFALERERLLDELVFQGGTSLRLCHGSSRFSEYLDFVGGPDFSSHSVSDIKTCIEHYVARRYQLAVSVKQPSELRADPYYAGIRVDKWQISVVTAPERRDLPKQRVKLEIANVPAYTREPHTLNANYPFLPDGYRDLLIITESLDEVMADKLIALVNNEKYVRHRDIWDLQWLSQQGASPNIELVKKKLIDYSVEGYTSKARRLQERLPDIIAGQPFRNEMRRFLPASVLERTLDQPKFTHFLIRETHALLGQVVDTLDGQASTGPEHDFTL
ncbi:nucleotidyl transferase AbiEii/AbiGii toxin family protein [Halomonas sp. GXIMD04776]|uniref:nucleotidyl transferase AbiEii/AbiGii toxin family protein n=1 Tax=Halomonas sp. GXIMD04776 TaxID=3415605 RepID=UPI003C8749EE